VSDDASGTTVPGQDQATDTYRWILLGGVWLVYFCFGLVGASMAPIIPAITSDLGIDNATMGAILGTWQFVYIFAAIPCGFLLDSTTPRLSLLLGIAAVSLSALMRGLAPNAAAMFLAVALFGIGGPLISVGAPKVSTMWFEGKNRGLAIGIYTTAPALGGAAALALTSSFLLPILGGEWRRVMFVFSGISLVVGGLWFLLASHPQGRASHTGIKKSQQRHHLVVGILARRPVQLVLAMAVGVFFVNHGLNNWLPEILASKGLSASEAGYLASITMIVGIAGSLVIPRLAIPRRRLIMLAAIFACMGIAAVLLLFLPGGGKLLFPLILIGVARTAATGVIMLVLMELPGIRQEQHGVLGGIFFVAAEIGGMLGPLTIGVLEESSGGFQTSIWAIAAVSTALIILCPHLKNSPR
jgi:cyanate permease